MQIMYLISFAFVLDVERWETIQSKVIVPVSLVLQELEKKSHFKSSYNLVKTIALNLRVKSPRGS